MIYRVGGGFYHNFENAHDAALELVTKEDIYEYLEKFLSNRKLLEWCFQNNAFLDRFQEQILEAENAVIDDFYLQEVEFDDEEEEEKFITNVEFLDEEE